MIKTISRFFRRLSRWLAGLLDVPARWGRNLSAWSNRRSSSGQGALNRAEGWLSALLRGLVWIVRRPVEVVERWTAKQVPKKKSVDSRKEEAELKLALKQKAALARRNQTLANSWVGRIGTMVLRPFGGFVSFAVAFIRTRSWATVLWGIPVLLMVSILMLAVLYKYAFDNQRIAARYETALADAIKAGETEQANQFRLKLEQLGVMTDRGEYRVALSMAEAKDLNGAYERMQRLAPTDKPGFPGAHYWIIQHLMDGKLGVPVSEASALALQHIQQLRNLVGNQPDLIYLEALARFQLEEYAVAKNLLSQIDRTFQPALALQVEIAMRMKEKAEAREYALALLRQLTQSVETGRSLTDQEQSWQVAAGRLIGDQQAVDTAIENWYRANPNSPDARSNRAIKLLTDFDRWLRNPELEKMGPAVESFLTAARLLPEAKFDLIRERLGFIQSNQSRSPAFAQFRAKIYEQPDVPMLMSEFFGALAAANEEWDVADRLLKQVLQIDPTQTAAWNNRAHALNWGFPERRQEALEYANKAVELDENNPSLRETRGMVHFNLKQWDKAIEDLEMAANGVQKLERVLQSLAICYQETGRPEVAEVYRKQARRQQ
ncbi:MAG: hypothetical protein JNL67_09430 [Planctomycetaceae bacterium]|nr:hypothetical protein [Planctomycetaceae bacterium]